MSDTLDYSVVSPDWRDELRKLSENLRKLIKSTTPLAREIGEKLTTAKEKLPHGQFTLFCKSGLGLDPRLAQLYMRIAELAQSIDPDMIERLPLSVAHRLAARNAPTDVVSEVIAEVKAGEMPTAADVKARIESARGKSGQKRVVSNVDRIAEMLVDVLDSAKLDQLAGFLLRSSPSEINELARKLRRLHSFDRSSPRMTGLPENMFR